MRRASEILRQAFEILERDQPASFYRVAHELNELTVHLQVDDEGFSAGFSSDRPRIVDPAPPAEFSASASTSRSVILDLCDGRIRLLPAIMGGRLDVRASETRLLRMSRAVTAFSEGAVRARRMRDLLESFRAEISAG
jgi:hypothetical protein